MNLNLLAGEIYRKWTISVLTPFTNLQICAPNSLFTKIICTGRSGTPLLLLQLFSFSSLLSLSLSPLPLLILLIPAAPGPRSRLQHSSVCVFQVGTTGNRGAFENRALESSGQALAENPTGTAEHFRSSSWLVFSASAVLRTAYSILYDRQRNV